ncbi:type II secretion system F family protein [Arthrobacter sp. KK5.5]|uniref:type II secretion system F family protein n=1 Tax=Arthrobacter sp. KK5.5 TaxID=3373084 RepID=UPI003EE6393D
MLLSVGLALLALAALLGVLTLALRTEPPIPTERRRPYPSTSTSVLSHFAGHAGDRLDRFLATRNVRFFNRETLETAGLRLSQSDFFILMFAVGAVLALTGLVIAGPGLALLLFLPTPLLAHLFVAFRTGKRRGKFDEQLGDTLQLLTGGLRAGHSILRAIDAAAVESASPTAEEMRRVVTETSLGKDLLSALNDTASRMASEDFVWIAQAIQINRQVGGNLAEVLEQVSGTIRERSEIKGQIKSLAAEGKMSAYILMGLPIGIVLMLLVVSPGYMDVMFTHILGWIMIGVSFVLMTIGGLWLRKIIDLKF